MTSLEAVRMVAQKLDESGVPSPRVDAEILVAHVLGVSRSEVYSADDQLSEEELRRLLSAQERRRLREPLAYILGEWGFRRLTLKVDRRVLVPRPETEVLVERCLEHLRDLSAPRVLDVGVGCGAIALAIADEHSAARILAVDRSADALAAARENLARIPVDGRMEFRQGDLLAGISGPFDLVVSNPPYVSPEDFDTLEPEVRLFEPREAIVGVGVGAEVARAARAVLAPGGWLLLECGDGQAADLAAEFERLGYADVVRTRDLADRERVVEGRWA
jgi:release factor glutamine methyltransferase